jgi:TolB-like protein/DNA-binding winged helix-turn-helix (wHTH) protein/lipopolysaccharide biosynthesis regulator YciM
VFEFGNFRLDCGRFELMRGGDSLRVERKPMELLILLVSRQGQLVTRSEIAQRLWSSEVFVDTEHGINTAIRKLRHLLRDDSEDPKFIRTVTGMGYRFVATTVAIGDAASDPHVAPAVEPAALDPEPRTPAPSPEELPKKSLAVRAAVVARFVALTVLFIVMGIGPRQIAGLLHRNADPPITSLAVIPLDNLSGDPSQEYFADGMTDELITMLAKDSTLRITSRTSVMQYKGARKPLGDIARALNVDGILEGSISRANGKVHMNLQLIRADTDAHLWAESYDRNDEDVAALPQQAAQAIAVRLRSASATSPPARYISAEAHDNYLRGRYLWFQGQEDKSIVYFKKAVELQPDYAAGWTGVADYYGAEAIEGFLDPKQALPQEEEAAVKAVQLDDSLAQAHLSLCAAIFGRWEWERADNECQRAIELDPKLAEAWHFRAKIYAALNRHPEAIEFQKKASELDPSQRPFALAYSYQLARQYDAALTEAKQRLEVNPNDASLHWILADIYRCKGEDQKTVAELEKLASLQGIKDYPSVIRRENERGGYKAVVREHLNFKLKESRESYVSPVELALQYATLGDHENAMAYLEKGLEEHSPLLLWIQCDPAYDFLHDDPRYRSLIQKVGLPRAY